jgi:hypothetical protein
MHGGKVNPHFGYSARNKSFGKFRGWCVADQISQQLLLLMLAVAHCSTALLLPHLPYLEFPDAPPRWRANVFCMKPGLAFAPSCCAFTCIEPKAICKQLQQLTS